MISSLCTKDPGFIQWPDERGPSYGDSGMTVFAVVFDHDDAYQPDGTITLTADDVKPDPWMPEEFARASTGQAQPQRQVASTPNSTRIAAGPPSGWRRPVGGVFPDRRRHYRTPHPRTRPRHPDRRQHQPGRPHRAAHTLTRPQNRYSRVPADRLAPWFTRCGAR